MTEPVTYVIESLVCSCAFMLVYRVLIIRRGSFGFARGYLVAAALLSLAIPLFNIPLWPGKKLLGNSPKWTPGENDGKIVRVQFMMDINFILER